MGQWSFKRRLKTKEKWKSPVLIVVADAYESFDYNDFTEKKNWYFEKMVAYER